MGSTSLPNIYTTEDNENFSAGGSTPTQVNHIIWQGLPGVYLAATSNGPMKSVDGGQTWDYIRPNATFGTTWPAGAIGRQVSFSIGPRECPPNPDIIIGLMQIDLAPPYEVEDFPGLKVTEYLAFTDIGDAQIGDVVYILVRSINQFDSPTGYTWTWPGVTLELITDQAFSTNVSSGWYQHSYLFKTIANTALFTTTGAITFDESEGGAVTWQGLENTAKASAVFLRNVEEMPSNFGSVVALAANSIIASLDVSPVQIGIAFESSTEFLDIPGPGGLVSSWDFLPDNTTPITGKIAYKLGPSLVDPEFHEDSALTGDQCLIYVVHERL